MPPKIERQRQIMQREWFKYVTSGIKTLGEAVKEADARIDEILAKR